MCEEGYFRSHDGLDLFEQRWEPEGEVRGNVVLVHGYGEHSSRYGHLIQALNGMGVGVHAFDQRNHGLSPGKRGYVRDFDLMLEDLAGYLDHIRARLDGKPHFVMGHSMGALILASYVQTRALDARGLIFSSALLAINDEVSRFLVALAGVLGTLTPWLPVASMDTAGVSRDPEVVEAYDADPLNFHGRIVARTGSQLNAAIARARANFERITAPVYIIHGTADALVPDEGSRLLHDRCRSDDKTLRIYEGGYHELHNDIEKEAVIADLCAWIGARL